MPIELPDFMKRKLGPLPVWAYAAVVGGIGIALMLRKGNVGQSSTPAVIQPQSGLPLTNGVIGDNSSTSGSSSPQPASQTLSPSTLQLTNTPSPGHNGIAVWSYDKNHQGILGFLPPGTSVQYIGEAPGFFNNEPGWLVSFGGQTGWISGNDVSGASAPAPAQASFPTSASVSQSTPAKVLSGPGASLTAMSGSA